MANRFLAFEIDELIKVWFWWISNRHLNDDDQLLDVELAIAQELYDAIVSRDVHFAKYHPDRP